MAGTKSCDINRVNSMCFCVQAVSMIRKLKWEGMELRNLLESEANKNAMLTKRLEKLQGNDKRCWEMHAFCWLEYS